MIELRVYASLLSRRAQTFLLTVQSVLNCRDRRLLEKLPKAELFIEHEPSNAITRKSRGKRDKNFRAYKSESDNLMKRTSKCEVENGIGQIGNSILDGRESRLSSNTLSTIGLDR